MLILKDISLVQFKNYRQATFPFQERIIGICGNNGIGKTNLLDAVYYLCFTKSYFTKSDQQNVLKGAEGFRIEGHFENGNTLEDVTCIIRENGKKELYLDGDQYEKLSHHIGRFPCVIIAPDDTQLITAGSEERRRLIDALLCQLDMVYLQSLMGYNKVLQQRNGFLKSISEGHNPDKGLLDVYDEQLIRPGSYVFEKRQGFLQDFLPLVRHHYREIAGTEEPVGLEYKSQLLSSSFPDLLHRFRDKDLYLQRTTGGIHRDDIDISFGGEPFKNMASQGQRKSLLFALKLAEYETLKDAKGFPPLLLLDDVFEKLDDSRMHNLLDKVCRRDQGQIFITDTHADRVREEMDRLGLTCQIINL